ncbi:MAG: 16S rRNA (cytosine(1402)-N(4))-methyltransferase RsmH [Clostridia bacterium]|jgi:16S rRNA (cytosine1402-N4)-methyltransferase|nr:16S rRNA (cytosine(1402)-N(4))-methyltransferase RsmH [Clostridia bacterium]
MENTLENKFEHTPVMLEECIDSLNIQPHGTYVDGTLGGGGHSSEIAKRLTTGRLIAIDKDQNALNHSTLKLSPYQNRVTFVKSDFKDMTQVLDNLGIDQVDGILLDLGVSSHQIDTAERGFSYRFDGKLDMRMDRDARLTAYDVVNTYDAKKLERVLFVYGEESFAKTIVRNIVAKRQEKPIETTLELVKIIEDSIPKKFWGKGSVAKKTFQAIRIEVNHELEDLDVAINGMISRLSTGGRIAIITFHSLEDRIVKQVFKEHTIGCICDKSVPICVCNHKADAKLVNKKPIEASKKELDVNKRSSSAKLRVLEKI